MPEESHLEEMSAAIRAQRERQAVPRSMISTEDARAPEQDEPAEAVSGATGPAAPPGPAPPAPRRGLLARLRGR